jgi:hypothetical protein
MQRPESADVVAAEAALEALIGQLRRQRPLLAEQLHGLAFKGPQQQRQQQQHKTREEESSPAGGSSLQLRADAPRPLEAARLAMAVLLHLGAPEPVRKAVGDKGLVDPVRAMMHLAVLEDAVEHSDVEGCVRCLDIMAGGAWRRLLMNKPVGQA